MSPRRKKEPRREPSDPHDIPRLIERVRLRGGVAPDAFKASALKLPAREAALLQRHPSPVRKNTCVLPERMLQLLSDRLEAL